MAHWSRAHWSRAQWLRAQWLRASNIFRQIFESTTEWRGFGNVFAFKQYDSNVLESVLLVTMKLALKRPENHGSFLDNQDHCEEQSAEGNFMFALLISESLWLNMA